MTRNTDPTDWEAQMRRIDRRLRSLETATPLASASITRGALRIASPEGLIVEGTARVVGTLNGDGTIDWNGPARFDGPVTIVGAVTRSGNETATGSTTLNGLTTMNGDLIVNSSSQVTFNGPVDVNGSLDVTGDVDVLAGGAIQAGAVTITPASGGQVQVGSTVINSGGEISNTAGQVVVADALRVEGELAAQGIPAITGVTANVYLDPFGNFHRISS